MPLHISCNIMRNRNIPTNVSPRLVIVLRCVKVIELKTDGKNKS